MRSVLPAPRKKAVLTLKDMPRSFICVVTYVQLCRDLHYPRDLRSLCNSVHHRLLRIMSENKTAARKTV